MKKLVNKIILLGLFLMIPAFVYAFDLNIKGSHRSPEQVAYEMAKDLCHCNSKQWGYNTKDGFFITDEYKHCIKKTFAEYLEIMRKNTGKKLMRNVKEQGEGE
jgi:hypothetical protein